jgi:K+-transporting ATPase A subunit
VEPLHGIALVLTLMLVVYLFVALSFNTAVSFASNTNWQFYGGETTMSYLSQMAALTVQNFLSAASGMAVLVALIRGLSRQRSDRLGNFWVDMTRSVLYILLPLSLLVALLLVSQGVAQTLSGAETAVLLDPTTTADGTAVSLQTIARGPVASQVAIKQLGTNGGGFYNVNSAHPAGESDPAEQPAADAGDPADSRRLLLHLRRTWWATGGRAGCCWHVMPADCVCGFAGNGRLRRTAPAIRRWPGWA